ncbi:hypothetical protein [Chamaesiphon sp. VAR_48_metabat_135_sub]|uniref:hypothetical protein n=1 Tax=Chamaesiphon sp. VAR_48_metabat_135_sub TaxID=2964699 RepID=UPI00286CA762|nr:hypothetical protein [Chamaesiphon sp. VAR_48_metabat_135_sub]
MLFLKAQAKTNTSGYFHKYFNNLFVKKRQLTEIELDSIDRVQADWQNILGSTVTDRAKAESSVKDCYQYANLNIPNIIWADHPLNVIKILINRPDLDDISGLIIQEIWQSELAIQRSICPESAAYILSHLNPQQPIDTPIGTRQIAPIANRLNELVMSQVNNLYYDLTERKIPPPLQDYQIGDLGYFDYFLRIGLNIPRIKPVIDLAKSGGWCWTFEKLAILTPKPSKIKIDRRGKIIGIFYNGVNILSGSNQAN